MKLYLDTCSLQRPLDDKTSLRVRLEADAIAQRARALNNAGIAPLDSLHLAFAEAANADFFCTCDDVFLKKAKREVKGNTRAVSPLELAEIIEQWESRQDR